MTVVGEWFSRPGNPVWSKMETAYPQVARRYARDIPVDQAFAVNDHTLPCKDVLCMSWLVGAGSTLSGFRTAWAEERQRLVPETCSKQ
jgi:hypothetical protein